MAILKPLKTNPDNIDLDALELFEQVQEELSNTGRVKTADFKRLIAAMFEDWTVAEAGKITRGEMPQIIEALGKVFDTVPLESDGE
jgi:hypothetical protein